MSVFLMDPCGLICILMTYVAVFYADYVVVKWIIMQTMPDRYFVYLFTFLIRMFPGFLDFYFCLYFSLWAPFHVVLFNTVIFLVSFSHLRAMCSDPGAVPLPQSRMDFSDIHSGKVCI